MYHTPVYLDSACLKQEPAQYHTISEHAGHTISYKQQNIQTHNIPHQATLNHTNNLITSSLPGYSLSPPAAPQAYPILPYRIIPHHIALHHTKPYHYSWPPLYLGAGANIPYHCSHRTISDHSIQQHTKPYPLSTWILPVSASSPATMEITIGDPWWRNNNDDTYVGERILNKLQVG